MEASVEFLSAGGNENPSTADVDSESGLVAFGAGQNLALWHPRTTRSSAQDAGSISHGLHALLSGHTAPVSVVRFLRCSPSSEPLIISGSADASIRVWTPSKSGKSNRSYQCGSVLSSHTKSVNAIVVVPDMRLFVSAGADSEIKVWRLSSHRTDEEVHDVSAKDPILLQSFNIKPTLIPMTLALASIPESDALVLAVAGSKPAIQIYVAEGPSADFALAATLSGHEGWVRSLDLIIDPSAGGGEELLLASASQDKYIRLWRLQSAKSMTPANGKFDAMATMIGGVMSNKAHPIRTRAGSYAMAFEALLVGHEDWIFSVRWLRGRAGLRLLSASADNSLALWEPEESSGVWTCTVRLGEISAQKGATTATGSTGGFRLGLWQDSGRAVMSLGKTGSWRFWRHYEDNDTWVQDVAVTGHTRSVEGIAWSRSGSYLHSTSSDMTTRTWAKTREISTWRELSRPQIHGYELNCIDTISDTRFISGADEKLLRVFDEPRVVAERLSRVCGLVNDIDASTVEAVTMPVLGLSNKAIDAEDNTGAWTNGEVADHPVNGDEFLKQAKSNVLGVPTEDQLSRQLLWHESEKLYGHGYEICACAVSRDGSLVATACKASSITHAAIRIYNTTDWRLTQPPLEAHSLTVTRLRFSPDDKYLLSVSRDRHCAVFARHSSESYTLLKQTLHKAHTRMILDATWLPLDAGDPVFATAGRDKLVHLWRLKQEETGFEAGLTPDARLEKLGIIDANTAVTAVDCTSMHMHDAALLAYGLEDGSIHYRTVSFDGAIRLGTHAQIGPALQPSKSITQLVWRPQQDQESIHKRGFCMLAASSEDCSVRIFRIPAAHDDRGEQ